MASSLPGKAVMDKEAVAAVTRERAATAEVHQLQNWLQQRQQESAWQLRLHACECLLSRCWYILTEP